MSVPTEEAMMTLIKPQPVFFAELVRGTAVVPVDIMVVKFCFDERMPVFRFRCFGMRYKSIYIYIYMLLIFRKKIFQKKGISFGRQRFRQNI